MVRILVTNDDGIHSEGLRLLEESLREVGDVYVVAPASEMSGASHSLTLSRPLRIRKIDERHWTIDGTPTDCVLLALNKIMSADEQPHICVSGINYGANLGDDVSYSGTVAGALEGTILGVPSIAMSLVAKRHFDFTDAAKFAVTVVRKVLKEGLPKGTLLNVNVPQGEIKGVRLTKQGIKQARPTIMENTDPRGRPYFWIGQQHFSTEAGEGTDYRAVEEGYISVTPIRSDMTDHPALASMEDWNNIKAEPVLL